MHVSHVAINHMPLCPLQWFAGLCCALMIGVGMAGAIIIAPIVDKSKKFEEFSKAGFALATVCILGFLIVSIQSGLRIIFTTVFIHVIEVIPFHNIIGASRPDGIPYGFANFFFLFVCLFCFVFLTPHFQHVLWQFVVKKTTDWAEILQNHTYGHASCRNKQEVQGPWRSA